MFPSQVKRRNCGTFLVTISRDPADFTPTPHILPAHVDPRCSTSETVCGSARAHTYRRVLTTASPEAPNDWKWLCAPPAFPLRGHNVAELQVHQCWLWRNTSWSSR
ncbi:hypothetical protein AOLI_G00252100 [Acnodon oligacanthus]